MIVLYLQPISEDIKHHEPLYEKIIKDAEEILKDTEEGPEHQSLVRQVTDIKDRWDSIVEKSEARTDEISRVIPEAKHCQTKVQEFAPKLAELEEKVNALPLVAVENEELEKQMAAAESIAKQLEGLGPINEEMTASCNKLVESPLGDLTVVAAEVENLKARYVIVLERLSEWREKVNVVNDLVGQYKETKKPVEEVVGKAEESTPVHDAPVADTEAAKAELAAVEKAIQELDGLRSEKADATRISAGILKEVGDESPKVAVFKEGVATLEKRYVTGNGWIIL